MADYNDWARGIRLGFDVNCVPTDLADLLAAYALAEKEYKAAQERLRHRVKRVDCNEVRARMPGWDRDDD